MLKQSVIPVTVSAPQTLLFKTKQTVISGRVEHNDQVSRSDITLSLTNEETDVTETLPVNDRWQFSKTGIERGVYTVSIQDKSNCYQEEQQRVTVAAQQDVEVIMRWSEHRLAYRAEEDQDLKMADKQGLDKYAFKKGVHYLCVPQKKYSLVDGDCYVLGKGDRNVQVGLLNLIPRVESYLVL